MMVGRQSGAITYCTVIDCLYALRTIAGVCWQAGVRSLDRLNDAFLEPGHL